MQTNRLRIIWPGAQLRLVFLLWLLGSLNLKAQSNGVLREVFYNIGGSAVSDLTNAPNFPASADQAFVENAFEAPSNFADNYGQRMRALLCPPATGAYTFWIASDDNSVLFLSRDEDPAHKSQIAFETSWTNPRQYTLHPSQKSAPITLTNGLRYYIEALQKDGTGGDNLAVTWQKPGDPVPADNAAPIPGTYLVPYGLGPPVIAAQPTNMTVVEGSNAFFMVKLAQKLGATYQWRRGGVAIAGATNSVYLLGSVGVSDSGSQFSCLITNGYGTTNSTTATLTVNPDVTRPSLVSVSSLGEGQSLIVVFSEPVEAASATTPGNYVLSGGINVVSAAFGADTRTIILSTTLMVAHTTYTLTVNNVRDRARTPNVILPNSQRSFSLDPVPLDSSFLLPAPETIGASTRHGPVVLS
ncbi:MAG TPA: hypothetical protein VNZ22_19315, partial [Bacillota bacterium]|nr:hypothetical protein [Bacillota bacterium]